MTQEATRYPLSWPAGWKRTNAAARQRARFHGHELRSGFGNNVNFVKRSLTLAQGLSRLLSELDRLGAANAIVSTNVAVRLDGLPRSGQGEPADPGAAVYFRLAGKPRCLACDRWNRVADNLAAIAGHVYAIRAVDRYGVGTMEQAFAGYAQLPAAVSEWWTILGLDPNATADQVKDAQRRLAFQHHPDRGGSTELMARINRAADEGVRAAR